MMGERRVDQSALFYEFSLERHVPADHMLRAIDRFVELDGLRAHLAPFYSAIGRPSIDPELLIRMLGSGGWVFTLGHGPYTGFLRQGSRGRAAWKVGLAPISLKKASVGNWHEGGALIHSGR